MADIVSPEKRSRMMSGIKGKDTKPELIVRKELFRRGFRYRLHDKKLPGKPDLVFPKYKATICVHGCFWHGHECHLFKWPKSNREFWREKIVGNMARDEKISALLALQGWRIAIVWECALKGKGKQSLSEIADALEDFLHGSTEYFEVLGKRE